jgi:hypothetical protein
MRSPRRIVEGGCGFEAEVGSEIDVDSEIAVSE